MTTKRITRQELSEDALTSTYHRAQEFLSRYWRLVVVGGLLVVAVVVAILLIVRSREASEKEASSLIRRGQEALLAGDNKGALEVAEGVLDRYGPTSAADRALLVKADALAYDGRGDEAEPVYRNAISELSDPILRSSARRGLAVLLENRSDFAGAAELYEQLGEEGEPPAARLYDLRAAARCRAALGQRDEAIEILRRLIERYESETDRVRRDQVYLAKVALAELEFAGGSGN